MSNNKSIELITALLDGKTLEKNHAKPGDGWFELREHISTLSSYTYNGERYFEVKGWGSAFGGGADRIIEILTNPEQWSIVPNKDQNVQASVASNV